LAAAILLGCAPSPQTPTDASQPLSLPFPVSYYFTPTGAEGDAASMTSPNAVTVSEYCETRAPDPDGPRGDCYVISYTQAAGAGFAGDFWQFPPNNWGTEQGRRVSPGATQVTFYARALGTSPLQVNFAVGGIGDTPVMPPPYYDTVDDALGVKLSSEWQAFSIPIKEKNYDWVLSGFSWNTPNLGDFQIDDVQWQ
jgi:hypothetical protein